MSDDLPMWTVYDHPADFPDTFVARKWLVGAKGPRPTPDGVTGELENIRAFLHDLGLVCLARSDEDDSTIVETWL